MDRKKAGQAFQKYTEQYDTSDINIALKIAHTYRVAELAARIAKSMELSDGDVDFAWFLGLLHDIGRFEQLTKYGTFKDAESVDHAELGADLLFAPGDGELQAEPLIAAFPTKGAFDKGWERIAETAVRLHNKLTLPDALDSRTLLFCNILRDADKCDIFRVLTEPPYDARNARIIKASESDAAVPAREAVMQCVSEHRCVPKTFERTEFESLISQCCMAFELNETKSREIVREQGYLDRLLSLPLQDDAMRKQLHLVKCELEKVLCADAPPDSAAHML